MVENCKKKKKKEINLIVKEEQVEIGKENKLNRTKLTYERKKSKVQQEQQTEEGELKNNEEVRAYQPPIPFPQRPQNSKLDEQFAKFLKMFKKLEINIPFAEALAQMPHYAKFMKDILKKKGSWMKIEW